MTDRHFHWSDEEPKALLRCPVEQVSCSGRWYAVDADGATGWYWSCTTENCEFRSLLLSGVFSEPRKGIA